MANHWSYGSKWRCRTCGKWMDGKKQDLHKAQHRAGKKRLDAELGKTAKEPTGKDRLKAKAKAALSLVNTCAYCKREGTVVVSANGKLSERGPDGLYWNMDHIVPWSVAQIESLENYVKSCHTCNIAKKANAIYPSIDVMTASHLNFGSTNLYQTLVAEGAIIRPVKLSDEAQARKEHKAKMKLRAAQGLPVWDLKWELN